MITEKMANQLNLQFQRIFCLSISRSTLRDLQQVLLILAEGKTEKAQELFELFITGQIKEDLVEKGAYAKVKEMVERYTIPCRMAAEIFERGDFLGSISTELLKQDSKPYFVNRVRKIDGQEVEFFTDPQLNLFLVHHFITRLEELKGEKQVEGLTEALVQLNERVEALIKDSKDAKDPKDAKDSKVVKIGKDAKDRW